MPIIRIPIIMPIVMPVKGFLLLCLLSRFLLFATSRLLIIMPLAMPIIELLLLCRRQCNDGPGCALRGRANGGGLC